MDANAPLPPASCAAGGDSPSPAPCPAELIVQAGRHAGTRRPLTTPLTLLGQAPGCDVRLNADSVHPLHCAIFHSPDGLLLRDLGSASGTFVNDQRVATCPLRDGDTLAIGPFQFRVRWEQGGGLAAEPALRPGERDALRVQAAAVAAQQAALLDEENRLQQRRTALEKQEEQLAAHLEERRLALVSTHEEVRQEKALLQKERAAFEQERRTRLEETARNRDEAAQSLKKAQTERGRLLVLRRRLRQRWRRHWNVREQAIAHREREVSRACEQFGADRVALTQARLRFNGEAELGRRQLRDGWDELAKARRQWQAERQRDEAELARQRREIRDARDALVATQQATTVQQARAQAARVSLDREVNGLENRTRNLRLKIAEYEEQLARLREQTGAAPPPTAEPVTATPPAQPHTAVGEGEDAAAADLGRLAAVLADQRLHLAEQWERFLRAQQAWHDEHASLGPQFEEAARALEEREYRLVEQEQAQSAAAEGLRGRQQALSQLRSELEAWQARLSANEAAWRAERSALLAQVQTREALAERRHSLLESLRKRWAARRKQELDLMARELKRSRETHRRYAELSADVTLRAGELAVRERGLAERTLALEQYQLELIGRSDNSVAAERRLLKLQKQIAGLHAEAERRLSERRQTLEDEAEKQHAQAQHLHQRAEALLGREAALSGKQREWENRQLTTELEQEGRLQELLRLRQQGEAMSRHEKELQDVIDSVIRVLLEETDATPSIILAA